VLQQLLLPLLVQKTRRIISLYTVKGGREGGREGGKEGEVFDWKRLEHVISSDGHT